MALNALPSAGFVFWPVGNGDSTTVVVREGVVVQVDLHHMAQADDDDASCVAIVDALVNLLPRRGGRPYLAAFVLTHPDQDHSKGFAELLKRVHIGEIWMSPRTFSEYKVDLCDDAKAFCAEAERRIAVMDRVGVNAQSGDRIRIIGYDDILREPKYAGFPASCLSIPGNAITRVDGLDLQAVFRAFVHAPFKDDADGERNDCSVALQVGLSNGSVSANALLMGDLSYPVLRKIAERSQAADSAWHILLTPHHCSKSAMYAADNPGDEERLKHDILNWLEQNKLEPSAIVSSSMPIPDSNVPGDNPPHAKAKKAYLSIGPARFLCTHEHGNRGDPTPIVFALGPTGPQYVGPQPDPGPSRGLGAAVAAARGSPEPPKKHVGFGGGH